MSFQKYPRYKTSTVKWLGHVPEHWETGRLRWLSTRYAGGTPDKANPEFWSPATIPWLNSGAVNQSFITEPSEYISQLGFENSSARWMPEGALVMALAGQGKTKGMVAQLGLRTTCNQSLAAIVPGGELSARFLYWWLTANYENIRNMAGGDLRDGLNLELLGDIECPIPTPWEQNAIATLLDRETAKIDGLIAEQEHFIELLKEKRRAVISYAVTNGLNPDAQRKPSGVEWLGDIPGRWEVRPLKHLVRSIEQGWSPQCEAFPVESEDEWGVLKVGCVNGGRFDASENKKLPDEFAPVPELALRAGDLLVSRANTRELVGSAAVVETDSPNLMLCDKLYRLRVDPTIADPYFVAHYLATPGAREQIELQATGASASMVNIAQSTIMNLPVVVPPTADQKRIVSQLAHEVLQVDALVREASHAISLLQERRSAVISAAVTGKIDVRGVVKAEAA